MHVQLSLHLHFYLLYLLLNSCDGNDAKQRVFIGRLLMATKKSRLYSVLALKSAGFSLADVQSDVLLTSHMHTTAFSIGETRTALTFCGMLAHVSMMHYIKSLVSRTCVLYNVHTFLHQSPNSVVDRVSGQPDCLVDTDLNR